jgi:hypothetical protein
MPVLNVDNVEIIEDADGCLISYEARIIPRGWREKLESEGAEWSWQEDGARLCWQEGVDEIRFAMNPAARQLLEGKSQVLLVALHPRHGVVDSASCALPAFVSPLALAGELPNARVPSSCPSRARGL